MIERSIASEADLVAGLAELTRRCPTMRRLARLTGPPRLRRHPAGFPGLARIVVGQQLSLASAEAIWGRLAATVRPMQPARLLATGDAELKAAGLSAGKIKTLRAVGSAVAARRLDLSRLARASDEDVHAALTAISGIGPWTADIYLLFCLGRADAWAAGDLALQTAAQLALELDERPSAVELTAIAERWRPWRGVAAHVLWGYYGKVRKVGGVA
jgi:DNA-3-methyladenine glycosylase II